MPLRPSAVGTYFSRDECEKYIHKEYEKEKSDEGVREHGPVFKAHTERGNAFEDDVIENLRRRETVIDLRDEEPLCESTIMGLLQKHRPEKGKSPTVYFAQFPLAPVELSGVLTSRSFPDILQIDYSDTSITITIIDIKSSPKPKISHWSQITTYRLILLKIMESGHIKNMTISTKGEVWTPSPGSTPGGYIRHEMCLLALSVRVSNLIKRMNKKVVDPEWQLSTSCMGCDYLNECRTEAVGTVKSIPSVSKARFKKLTDIEDLVTTMKPTSSEKPTSPKMIPTKTFADPTNMNPVPTIPSGSGLSIPTSRLTDSEQLSFDTLSDKVIRPRPFRQHLLSASSPDTYVIISLLRDYQKAVGVAKETVIGLFDSKGEMVEEKVFGHVSCRHFISYLSEALSKRGSCNTVEIFTSTDSDRFILTSMLCTEYSNTSPSEEEKTVLGLLLDHDSLHCLKVLTPDLFSGLDTYKLITSTPKVSQWGHINWRRGRDTSGTKEVLVKRLLSTFDGDGDLVDSIRRELGSLKQWDGVRAVPYLISSLCCLPVVGFCSSEELYEVFELDFPTEDELVASPSHDMPNMLRARCRAAVSVVKSIRENFSNSLKGPSPCTVTPMQPPAVLPLSMEYYNVHRMIYLKQLGLSNQCAEASRDRDTGEGVIIASISDKKSKILTVTTGMDFYERNTVAQEDSFRGGGWLVSFSSNLQSHVSFSDISYHGYTQYSSGWVPGIGSEFLCVGDLLPPGDATSSFKREWVFTISHDSKTKLVLYPDTSILSKSETVLAGFLKRFDTITLSKRVVDCVYDKSVEALVDAVCPLKGVDSKNLFSSIFSSGSVNITPLTDPPPKIDTKLGENKLLTQSQSAAVSHATNNRLQLVWGPPGTGKTTYLSHVILDMIKLNWNNDHYSILVTAVTRSAISELITRIGGIIDNNWFSKCVVGYEDPKADQKTSTSVDRPIKVFGTTAWKLGSKRLIFTSPCPGQPTAFKSDLPQLFDLIVIDEGSLMVVGDTPKILNSLKPETGRLIVAGDHLQLPPIQEKVRLDTKQFYPSGSILSSLMLTDDNQPIEDPFDTPNVRLHGSVVKLVENLRSNKKICEFTARLYGPDYVVPRGYGVSLRRCETFERLIGHGLGNINALATVLHSNRRWSDGMLAVKVVGDDVTVQDEATLMVELARAIRLLVEGGDKMEVFAVVPTRNQRASLSHSNSNSSTLSSIDTINSMQGRTCDVTIAGYSCPSRTQFLYDICRLNVALTRARSLNVLVVTDAVLSPDVSICDSNNTLLGYQHLREYVNQAEILHVQVSPFKAYF